MLSQSIPSVSYCMFLQMYKNNLLFEIKWKCQKWKKKPAELTTTLSIIFQIKVLQLVVARALEKKKFGFCYHLLCRLRLVSAVCSNYFLRFLFVIFCCVGSPYIWKLCYLLCYAICWHKTKIVFRVFGFGVFFFLFFLFLFVRFICCNRKCKCEH